MLTEGTKRPLAAAGDIKNLRTLIESTTEPVVGCNQVVEYVSDTAGVDARYSCTLCDMVAPSAGHMLAHLTSNKHRNAYIDRFEGRAGGGGNGSGGSGGAPVRSAESTRHICTLIETRMGRMVHAMRTVTGSVASFGTDFLQPQQQTATAGKRARTDQDGVGRESKNVSSTSGQSQNSSERAGDAGLAVSEGPLGELLKQLSKCVVKNESDASMALYVSRALLGSLLDYRSRQQPEQSALLKDMLRTMGGMLRTMTQAVDGSLNNNNNNNSNSSNNNSNSSKSNNDNTGTNTTSASQQSTNTACSKPSAGNASSVNKSSMIPPQQQQQQASMPVNNMAGQVAAPTLMNSATSTAMMMPCGNMANNAAMPAQQFMYGGGGGGGPNMMGHGGGGGMMGPQGPLMAGPTMMGPGVGPMMGPQGPSGSMVPTAGPNQMMTGPNNMMMGRGGPPVGPLMPGPNQMMAGPNNMMMGGGGGLMMCGPSGPMMPSGPNNMMSGGPNMNGPMMPMNNGLMGPGPGRNNGASGPGCGMHRGPRPNGPHRGRQRGPNGDYCDSSRGGINW